MANPNSLLTKIRINLARWLDPCPDRGEAWCVDCAVNGGRTLVLNANGHAEHVQQHTGADDKTTSYISIRANYGYVPAESEEP